MSIQYHIYVNDFAGGPIDFTTIIATVSGLTYTPAAIPINSDVTFAIRAFDTVTGLEEGGTSAIFRIVTDGTGLDITNIPRCPLLPVAFPQGASALAVRWRYPLLGRPETLPTGFHVYAGTPTISYATPVVTVTFSGGQQYTATLIGLTAGSVYQIGVRAFNAQGEEKNTQFCIAIPLGTLSSTPVIAAAATVGLVPYTPSMP